MVKVRGPLFSVEAAGAFGDQLLFRRGPAGVRVSRPGVAPKAVRKKATAAQAEQRELFQRAVAAWHSKSVADRVALQAEADARGLPLNAYSMWLQKVLGGEVEIVEPFPFPPPFPPEYEVSGVAYTDDSRAPYVGELYSVGGGQVVAACHGAYGSVLLLADGSVVSTQGSMHYPRDVPPELSSDVVKISFKSRAAVALKRNGDVYAWGRDYNGETNISAEASTGAIDVAAGYRLTVVLSQSGEPFVFGYNFYGQTSIPDEARSGVVQVDCGRYHVVALKESGEVIAWGGNDEGQSTVPDEAKSGVVRIACGYDHTLCLKENGELIAFGSNDDGQLDIPDEAKTGIAQFSCGDYGSSVLKRDGSLIVWGDPDYGFPEPSSVLKRNVVGLAYSGNDALYLVKDLGDRLQPPEFPPVYTKSGVPHYIGWTGGTRHIIPAAAQSGIVKVSCGEGHIMALDVDGHIHSWGSSEGGVADFPASVQGHVVDISCGDDFSLILLDTGEVVSAGRTDYGLDVVPAAASSGCVRIAAGHDQALALTADGVPIAWGDSDGGMLDVPDEAKGESVALSIGTQTACALLRTGRVCVWGRDPSGWSTTPGWAGYGVTAAEVGYLVIHTLDDAGCYRAFGYKEEDRWATPETLGGGFVKMEDSNDGLGLLRSNGDLVFLGRNVGDYFSLFPDFIPGVIDFSLGRYFTVYLTEDT